MRVRTGIYSRFIFFPYAKIFLFRLTFSRFCGTIQSQADMVLTCYRKGQKMRIFMDDSWGQILMPGMDKDAVEEFLTDNGLHKCAECDVWIKHWTLCPECQEKLAKSERGYIFGQPLMREKVIANLPTRAGLRRNL